MYYSFSEKYTTYTSELKTKAFLLDVLSNKNPVVVNAIWDTGANRSCLSNEIRINLNIAAIGSRVVYGVNSKQYVDIVASSIKLPNDIIITKKRLYVCDLPPGVDMLIGMDIIQLGDFYVSNSGGKTNFSFVIPPLPVSYNLAEEADRLNNK